MRCVTTYSDEYTTNKAESLVKMDEANINVPRTVLINSRNIEIIDSFIEYIYSTSCSLDHAHYSVRLSFSDSAYPHQYQAIVKRNQIASAVTDLVYRTTQNNISSYDIIYQPLLEKIKWTGGVVKKGDYVFIELVYGAGQTIFKLGQFLYRYLHTNIYDCETFGNQNKYIKCEDGIFIEKEFSNCFETLQNVPKEIARSVSMIELLDNNFYEFGLFDDELIFFEYKELLVNSYDNLERVFIDKEYTVVSKQIDFERVITLDTPLFDYIDTIDNASSIYIKEGPILSHLAFHCARNQIKCIFKVAP